MNPAVLVSNPLLFVGKTLESLDPSLFTKNKPGKGGSNVKEREKQKEIAALEAQVYRFSGKKGNGICSMASYIW